MLQRRLQCSSQVRLRCVGSFSILGPGGTGLREFAVRNV